MPKTTKYKEDLIPRIIDLIDGYSSASILKEYIQNADDSGATELIITFDKQNYPKLKNTKYELANGKSLLLYNNSIFKEKDFESIVKISAKGKSTDATSTGRFGQGFSSSFSISDHPTFLSSNRIYWFDVLNNAVSKDEDDNILFLEDDEFSEISDWLETFKVAGYNSETVYDTSTNQEENYSQDNDKEEIVSPLKPIELSINEEISASQKSRKGKGEIAPPTQPKISSEKEKVDRENSLSPSSRQGNRTNNFEGNSSNKGNRKIVSSNDRKPVYVGKDREVDEEQQKNQKKTAKAIGDKGEFLILDNKNSLLLSSTNYFQKAPTNNRGFDIYEKDQSGKTVRYIEVKTLTSQWGEGGVGITEHQLDFAQKQKDKWWLFVVENINTANTKIYQFKNPVLEANRFMFDSSWKQLAYT